MPKFNVTVVKTVTYVQLIEDIEAADSCEAEEIAESQANESGFWDGVPESQDSPTVCAVDYEEGV